jgi:hypothetical protein
MKTYWSDALQKRVTVPEDEMELEGGYSDLHGQFGWTRGVHKAPVGYQHPWLVVLSRGTYGTWSREKARQAYRQHKGE